MRSSRASPRSPKSMEGQRRACLAQIKVETHGDFQTAVRETQTSSFSATFPRLPALPPALPPPGEGQLRSRGLDAQRMLESRRRPCSGYLALTFTTASTMTWPATEQRGCRGLVVHGPLNATPSSTSHNAISSATTPSPTLISAARLRRSARAIASGRCAATATISFLGAAMTAAGDGAERRPLTQARRPASRAISRTLSRDIAFRRSAARRRQLRPQRQHDTRYPLPPLRGAGGPIRRQIFSAFAEQIALRLFERFEIAAPCMFFVTMPITFPPSSTTAFSSSWLRGGIEGCDHRLRPRLRGAAPSVSVARKAIAASPAMRG